MMFGVVSVPVKSVRILLIHKGIMNVAKYRENRALSNETNTANLLGEPTRASRTEGKPIKVQSSTYSCKSTKNNPC